VRQRRVAARIVVVGLVTAGIVPATAAAASAHPVAYGDDPTNWRSAITTVDAPPGAVSASLGDGAQRLTVSVHGAATVQVLGYAFEPFLLLSAAGVWENVRSATTSAVNGRAAGSSAGGVDSRTAPEWKKVSSTPSWCWHDARTHWPGYALPPPVEAHPDRRQAVLSWQVPLVVNGHEGAVRGMLTWVPGPSAAPAAAIGVLAFIAFGALGILRRWRVPVTIAIAALVSADACHEAGCVAARIGGWWTRLSALPEHGLISVAVWLGASLTGAAVIRRRGDGPLYPAAMFAAISFLAEGMPSLAVGWRSQATNALGVAVDRPMVAAITGASLGLLTACVLLLRQRREPLLVADRLMTDAVHVPDPRG
jgi:hypothetical protein